MTKQIIAEAVSKAQSAGWNKLEGVKGYGLYDGRTITAIFAYGTDSKGRPVPTNYTYWNLYSDILFNKDFLKAIWPNDWKTKAQEMVISDDPIEYLGRNLHD